MTPTPSPSSLRHTAVLVADPDERRQTLRDLLTAALAQRRSVLWLLTGTTAPAATELIQSVHATRGISSTASVYPIQLDSPADSWLSTLIAAVEQWPLTRSASLLIECDQLPAEPSRLLSEMDSVFASQDWSVDWLLDRRAHPAEFLLAQLPYFPQVRLPFGLTDNLFYRLPPTAGLDSWLTALERHAMRLSAAELSQHLSGQVIEQLPSPVAYTDSRLRFQFVNAAFLALTEQQPEQVLNRTLREVIGGQIFSRESGHVETLLRGEPVQFDTDYRSPSGRRFNLTLSVVPQRLPTGQILGYTAMLTDITDRKRIEEALRRSEERYRQLVENQGEGIALIDEHVVFQFLNAAAESLFGAASGSLVGRSLYDLIPPDHRPTLERQVTLRRAGENGTYEIGIQTHSGDTRLLLVTSTPRFDAAGEFRGSFVIFRDITDRKQMEDRLRFQSTHDSLTGLYNRLFFEEEIARLEHSRQFPISFIVIDLDKLKQVNDSDGHLAGDELLRRLAGVLRSTFRVEDIIARLGGDEFAVLLPNTGAVSLRRAVQRLRRNLTASNQACVDCLALSFSVGGATAELNSPLREALDRADRNMYRNKRSRNDS